MKEYEHLGLQLCHGRWSNILYPQFSPNSTSPNVQLALNDIQTATTNLWTNFNQICPGLTFENALKIIMKLRQETNSVHANNPYHAEQGAAGVNIEKKLALYIYGAILHTGGMLIGSGK